MSWTEIEFCNHSIAGPDINLKAACSDVFQAEMHSGLKCESLVPFRLHFIQPIVTTIIVIVVVVIII